MSAAAAAGGGRARAAGEPGPSENSTSPYLPRLPPSSFSPLELVSNVWTGVSTERFVAAEEALLRRFVRTPFTLGRVAIELPELELGEQHIATIDINADAPGVPIVLAHGHGAGLGFFYRNYDALANLGGVRRRVLGFDWLGQAGSSRPSFPYGGLRIPAWALSEDDQIAAAVRFSVLSLEAWREAVGLERFVLIAHSMGGYLAVHYALAHPSRVWRLVLASAEGVAPAPAPTAETDAPRRSPVLRALWGLGFANFGLAKTFGPLVRGAVREVLIGRLRITDEHEANLLFDYFWGLLTAQPLSADKTVNVLLEPLLGVGYPFYARRPVADEPIERLATLPPLMVSATCHAEIAPRSRRDHVEITPVKRGRLYS